MGHFISLQADGGSAVLLLHGAWRMTAIDQIRREVESLPDFPEKSIFIDGSNLEQIDTSGALILYHCIGSKLASLQQVQFRNFSQRKLDIIELVGQAYKKPLRVHGGPQLGLFAKIGSESIEIGRIIRNILSFVGQTFAEAFSTLLQPRLFRGKEFFIQLERAGINAIPIVALVTFLIGIVISYLFGLQTEKYGANIFLVDAVALAMCRELSPILVAIILAGRSGSAFTAQIGTMKISEEIDAMITLGLSPMRVIVLPRVFALMLALPLLTFVGDVFGILGGMVIADLKMNITGVTFLDRLQAVLPLKSVLVGLIKAPVFALFIAVIGCHMGFSVENNARSVGIHTTSTVVRSIVAVILLNAGFAILFVELGI